MNENTMPTGFERGDLFAPAPHDTSDKDVAQAYELLLQAKKQIESDEKEIERLKKQYTDHLELDADESMEFQAKYNMRVSERNAALRYRDELQSKLDALQERNMILEQGKELVLIQFSNDILTLLSGFDYATPEKGYDSPSLVLSDLNNFINGLRRGAIAEYQLRVQAEQTLRQMIDELKAVDMGDSETRIRIYHVLNKYNIL
jgi:vacuolar-type H+-ATPase subunit I/STV1